MERLFGTLELRSTDDELREFEGIANTASIDAHGTCILPAGARFTLPMPLLFHHDQQTPVGEITEARMIAGKWHVKGFIRKVAEPGFVQEITDRAWHNIKYQLMRGLSIGFKPLKSKGNQCLEWAWRELSIVTIPSNQDANIIAVRSAFGASADTPGVSGTATTPNPNNKPRHPMNYQEQITQFQNTRAAKVAQRDAVLETVSTEGETLDESQQQQYDALDAEIRSIDATLVRLETSKKDLESRAVPVNGSSSAAGSQSRSGVSVVRVRENTEPGIPMARLVRAIGIAHRKHRDLDTVVRELYPDSQVLHRAAVAAHNTTTDAALVSDESGVYADFVEYLRPQTILGKFGTNGIPSLRAVPFRTPLITQTGAGAGYWVGEGAAKPVTKFTWTRTTMDPLKVANIAVVTDELMRSSSPSADRNIRDSLVEALRARLDTDFIDPAKAASAGVSPASITNGVTPIPSAGTSGYVDADVVSEDVQAAMAGFIAANNAPTTGVWIMSATRALALSMMRNANGQFDNPNLSMNGGSFAGLPVIVSEYIDPLLVALVNASDIYLGDEGGFQVDASSEASLQMLDDPTNNSVTPTPTTLVSMFQTNSVAIRAERIINWSKRRASAVQLLEDVYWGASVPA